MRLPGWGCQGPHFFARFTGYNDKTRQTGTVDIDGDCAPLGNGIESSRKDSALTAPVGDVRLAHRQQTASAKARPPRAHPVGIEKHSLPLANQYVGPPGPPSVAERQRLAAVRAAAFAARRFANCLIRRYLASLARALLAIAHRPSATEETS